MEGDKLTAKHIEDFLSDLMTSKIIKSDRDIKGVCGRISAINYHNLLRKNLGLPLLTIEQENLFLEGVYSLGKTGCQYLGLWNENHPNGLFVKHNLQTSKHSLEYWEEGFRMNHKFISEQEFLTYKNNVNNNNEQREKKEKSIR